MSLSEGGGEETRGDELPREDNINTSTQGIKNCEINIRSHSAYCSCHSDSLNIIFRV